MEPFIVSARKYRPESFEDVVGQGAITKTLENAIQNNHLAQALLFTGPRGVGKTTCARILAKKINQESGHHDPDEDFAFNIFELDAASNNGVDQIRSIVDQVRIPPQVGTYKVYIIDEVHMLSNAAFNAFLKTLEEPPAHAIFILATTEKHKIIPTILSRCQIFDFKRITVSDMREHLKRIASKEGIEAEEEALQIIAQKADGALRDSLSIFDRVVSFSGKHLNVQAVTENLNVLDRETYFQVTELLLENNIPQLLVDYNEIMSKGFDGQHFISGLASHFRDLMVCKDERTIPLLELGEQTKAKYLEQSKKVDLAFLRKGIEIANDADFNYRASRNQRLLVELTLMQLASINLDGEKKNDLKQILPATYFKDQSITSYPQDTTISTETKPTVADNDNQVNTPVASTPEQIKAEPSATKPKPTQPSKDQQVATMPGEDTATETPSTTPNKSLEEARKALLQKSRRKVSGLSIQGIEVQKNHVALRQDQQLHQDKLPEEDFTQERLHEVWQQYIEHLKARGELILASILNADQPQLKGRKLCLKFPNESMKVTLEQSQGQVMEYIKRELRNYSIEFDILVDQTVTKKYVYTDQDKYSKLVEKNPAVDLLRRTFDLDF
ncbi:DNA polymerase III subunit gamma/tau [Nonlabens xiamenensis]|uniref:DNA polymerase III subunit gamma/tau n=1 Tax=Nonlabens xiamenensis TaxID=2341043 RepID=UPI000F6130EC|nr:DNA polymerase III subunit gamma/tau [Nonlabens xiamenensis]